MPTRDDRRQAARVTDEAGRLVVYVGTDLKARLRQLSFQRSHEEGRYVSMATVIRELLERAVSGVELPKKR